MNANGGEGVIDRGILGIRGRELGADDGMEVFGEMEQAIGGIRKLALTPALSPGRGRVGGRRVSQGVAD